jgi:hypothetical protein
MPNYPALPDHRMAYDRDGTIGFQIDLDTNTVAQLSTAELQTINNEAMDWVSARNHASHASYTGLIFPEHRDITAYFLANNGGAIANDLRTSPDTTTGLDGTWTSRIPSYIPTQTIVSPGYRNAIQVVSWTGIKALRFTAGAFFDNDSIYALHLYGNISTGETPDRLRLWHPTLDQEVDGDYFNWNDIQRGSSGTKQFRVKNNSSTLTASAITVAVEALTDTSPTVVGQHSLDISSIASLAPGVISSVITLTRTTPLNAILSIWAARVVAAAGSWA